MFAIKNKLASLPLPVRAAFWFTVCNISLKGINFLSSFIFTRILPQSEYGLLSVYTSYEQIFLVCATWEIQLGAYTRGLFKYKESQQDFTVSMQCLTNILTVCFFISVLAFAVPIRSFTGLNIILLILLFVNILLKPAYSAWLTRKRIVYDYAPAVFLTVLYSVSNVIVPYIAVRLLGNTANIKFGASLIASSVICFFLWIKNSDYIKCAHHRKETKQYWKFMLAYEGPLVIHSLSYIILTHADRIMIGKFVGNKETALYSIAYNIAAMIMLLQVSMDQVLTPWRYSKLDAQNYSEMNRISKIILIFYSMVVIIFVLIAPDIVRLLFPKPYYEGIWCIPPIATSSFFMFLYSFFVSVETYFEKTKYVLYVSSFCGIINIILNYYALQLYGYIACAYTTLISYILFALGHYYFMNKTTNEIQIYDEIYDIKTISLISLIVLGMTVIISLNYSNMIFRYSVFSVICIVLLILKKHISGLFHCIKMKT